MSLSSPASITLWVNGEPCLCPESTLLPDFLHQQGFNSRLIAVEYNGDILHRQYWNQTRLQAGDRLEVVTIVGGG
ncbi:sulfur carrier protein ThiS [Synechocystis sp. LKSZ1]|uniref:sulfur carrier protein ThiS n=1 Tax=Synechocystis sp. LKSZ1 TaxID=3144951 RepID=UPI00336C23B5